MSSVVRRAVEADLPIIQSLGAKLLEFERENYDATLERGWTFTKEAEEKYLFAIREKCTLIAEVDGEPVGYLIGKLILPTAESARDIKQAYIENLFVEESVRKQGIGKKLIDEFRDYCKKEGVSRLGVTVLADNEVALGFYKDVGFLPRSISLSEDLSK